MKQFARSIGQLTLAAALAACSDPAGMLTPNPGSVASTTLVPGVSTDPLTTVAPPGPLGTAMPWIPPFGRDAIQVYGNVGEGSTGYTPNVGWSVSGAARGGQNIAQAFVPNANYTVIGIALAIGHVSGPNVYKVSLNADLSGLPGAVLRSWTVTNVPGFGTCCAMAVVRSGSALPITQGIQYWVVASPESRNTGGAWNWNNRGATGPLAFTRNNGPWLGGGSAATEGAFAVFGKVN